MTQRSFRTAAATALMLLAAGQAFAGEARTVRIETRPFYGATVTIEHGVRVFRPLPPHRTVIINPGGKAKVNVTVEDRRVVHLGGGHSTATAVSGSDGGGGVGSYGVWSGRRHFHQTPRHRAHGHRPAYGHHGAHRPHHGGHRR